MRKCVSRLLAAFVVAASVEPLEAWQESGRTDPTQAYVALALQGDLTEARQALAQGSVDEGNVTAGLVERFDERFVVRSEAPIRSGNDFVDDVVTAYRRYWTRVLLNEATTQASEQQLNLDLRQALTILEEVVSDGPEIHAHIAAALRGQGFHYVQSPSPPMRDLVVWRSQRAGNYVIRLSDRTLKARVKFANGFISLGWKHFATLGLALTTGWVDKNMLFCVEWAYTPNTENFDISFLKHEGRHLSDLEQYPGLDTVEMEYRAKLTELAFARRSLDRLMTDFSHKAANNRTSPHAYANARVLNEIRTRLHGDELPDSTDWWSAFAPKRINAVAMSLLAESNASLSLESRQGQLP